MTNLILLFFGVNECKDKQWLTSMMQLMSGIKRTSRASLLSIP